MKLQVFRLKETEKQLKRIADALDYIILRNWDYRMSEAPKPSGEDESGVEYATDTDTLRYELINLKQGRPVNAPPQED